MAISVTLATLRADLRAVMNDPEGSYISAAQAIRFLNMGIEEVSHMFAASNLAPFAASDTVTLVADTAEYAIDKEIRLIEKVTILVGTINRPLEVIPFQDVERITMGSTSQTGGNPSYWYRRANVIGFAPTPSQAGTVTVYSQKQSDYLAADGDTISMPPWARNLIVFEAAVIASASKGAQGARMGIGALRDRAEMEMELTIMKYQSQDNARVNPLWDHDFTYRNLG